MNQLTTIAALPTASGSSSHLPPEVGEAKKHVWARGFAGLTPLRDAAPVEGTYEVFEWQLSPQAANMEALASLGYQVNDEGFIEALNAKNALVAKFWRGEQCS